MSNFVALTYTNSNWIKKTILSKALKREQERDLSETIENNETCSELPGSGSKCMPTKSELLTRPKMPKRVRQLPSPEGRTLPAWYL